MAINQPVAGQSTLQGIHSYGKGGIRVTGTERVDKRFNYLDEEDPNFVELTPEQIELTEQYIAIWAAIGGYEGGDADKVKTEVELEKDAIVAKEIVDVKPIEEG